MMTREKIDIPGQAGNDILLIGDDCVLVENDGLHKT